MKITDVIGHVLVQPNPDETAASSAQDDFIVEIRTDEGVTGFGETDLNPWIARACLEAPGTHNMGLGLREMLLGADPLDIDALWQRLYIGSAMNGRRGAVINVMGAIDIALHDLRGKALGKPVHELLGAPVRKSITPYASLQPETSSFTDYRDSLVDWARRATELGFKAVKTEVTLQGPYAHRGLRESWERSGEVVSAVRDAIGPDVVLMVDVQYAFSDVETALSVLREWEGFDLYFLETPLWPDDLAGHARLAAEQSIPIASGEWLTTQYEFRELLGQGRIQVAQPDVGRVGGLTEAMRVCDLAAEYGASVVPHLWKSGLSVAVATHLAMVTPHCAFIEYLPPELSESPLRKELTLENPVMVNGEIEIPSRPGLGVEPDPDALERYSAQADTYLAGRA